MQRNNKLSMQDKINLFREYLENNEGEIIQNTVIETKDGKRFPIGIMLAQIRSEIKNNPNKYSEDIKKSLEELGLLDKKNETKSDKVKRLTEFCEEYPLIWFLKGSSKLEEYMDKIYSPKEKNEIKKLLEKVYKDYTYIYNRKREKKFDEKNIEILKEAGVRRDLWF